MFLVRLCMAQTWSITTLPQCSLDSCLRKTIFELRYIYITYNSYETDFKFQRTYLLLMHMQWQEYNLDPSLEGMDNATPKNMDNLEKVGKNLLYQNVLRVNVNSFVPIPLDQTNAQALDRCVYTVSCSKIKLFFSRHS